jgi:hypothetical protein
MSRKILITDRSGAKLGQIVNYLDINYSKAYNTYGFFKIRMPITAPELQSGLIETNTRYLQFYKNDETSPRFDGIIINKKITLQESGSFITVSGFDLKYILECLDINQVWDATAVNSIIQEIYNDKIAETQLPFTLGTLQVTDAQDVDAQNSNFLEALQQLEVFGYGFDIENRRLNFYTQLGELKVDAQGLPTVVLKYGDGGVLSNVDYELDGTSFRNKSIALGAGSGINQVRSTTTDIQSRNDIGLFARYSNYPSFSKQSIIDTLSERDLEENSKSKRIITIQVNPERFVEGQFDVGDIVYIYAKEGSIEIGEWVRVMNIEYSENDLGIESVKLDIQLYNL